MGEYVLFSTRQVAMVGHTNRVLVILAALVVGVIFVLSVRTAGLHELAQRAHCASSEGSMQLQSCRAGDSSDSAE
jgi:hypothetical protein